MMRQMRDATKPIIFLALVAFVALMVFQWGMDITGQSSGGLGEIGRVNGDPVQYDEYMASYRNLYDQVQSSQEQPITTQQNKEIEDAAFDEVVNQILIRQELRRRGIDVTDREIVEAAQFSPPADLRPQFVNDAGQFDGVAYQTFLATLPPDQLILLEAYYRDVIPRGKLLRQVSSGIYLSDAELWQRYQDENEQVEIRFVALDPATRYDDSEFSIPQNEIEAYYRANEEEFAVPARASLKVVVLDRTPTPADTAAAADLAESFRQEIEDGADFAEVAMRESSDEGSAALGGDLGVFPKGPAPGSMVAPFDSAVFAASTRVGVPTPPVKTSFGYHIIEVTERWGQDSAQARHVLVPVARTDDSEIALLTLADSLEDLSETMLLDQAAAAAGLTSISVDITETFPFVAGAGQISEGADWVFEEASVGDVSPVFENAQAFYAVELLSSEPEGTLPLEDAAPGIESTLRFDLKMERAMTDGSSLLSQIAAGEALEEAASAAGLEVREAGPFTRNDFVPGIGRQNAAVGAAFGLRPGQLSNVVSTGGNAFLIELTGYAPADSAAWLGQTVEQRQREIGVLQQLRLQEWIAALRASARIVDRRDVVLAPQDENQIQLPMVF